MLNFGASKPRVKGGARAPGAPPRIRTCINHLIPLQIIADDEAVLHSIQQMYM